MIEGIHFDPSHQNGVLTEIVQSTMRPLDPENTRSDQCAPAELRAKPGLATVAITTFTTARIANAAIATQDHGRRREEQRRHTRSPQEHPNEPLTSHDNRQYFTAKCHACFIRGNRLDTALCRDRVFALFVSPINSWNTRHSRPRLPRTPSTATHVEPCRYGKGSNALSLPRHWSERTIILLVMQTLDNSITVSGQRTRTGRHKRVSGPGPGQRRHRPVPPVHGYDGLHIVDGSTISATPRP
ncbi:hypothetical protein [Amycolatopsis sp. cmx-11-12]|uniref:hypothetical protein n=1 Tax=Amycolatopsis sp. cmx-11-12 TaxID=2785795 RepID=UPI003917027C